MAWGDGRFRDWESGEQTGKGMEGGIGMNLPGDRGWHGEMVDLETGSLGNKQGRGREGESG